MLALSEMQGTLVLSVTGGVVLAALLAFGVWWSKPFRAVSRREARTLEQREPRRDEAD
jgi:cytoskeletal protein RodZ